MAYLGAMPSLSRIQDVKHRKRHTSNAIKKLHSETSSIVPAEETVSEWTEITSLPGTLAVNAKSGYCDDGQLLNECATETI